MTETENYDGARLPLRAGSSNHMVQKIGTLVKAYNSYDYLSKYNSPGFYKRARRIVAQYFAETRAVTIQWQGAEEIDNRLEEAETYFRNEERSYYVRYILYEILRIAAAIDSLINLEDTISVQR